MIRSTYVSYETLQGGGIHRYPHKGEMVARYKSWGFLIIFIVHQVVVLGVLGHFVKKKTYPLSP